MNRRPELGSKRNRNCVSPVQEEEEEGDAGMCESSNNKAAPQANLVWQQWTTTFFRASQRPKNDLLAEVGIEANVERHMTLMPNKKRSLFDDESDSDDESNYYKLDVPPPPQQRHPLGFTPSSFLPLLGPQVTPVSCDPDALPTCSLRRYGHDDDGFGCYDMEDRIPPPPSFHRYPSKKRAVGLARPEPEQDFYYIADARFHPGVSVLAERKDEATAAESVFSAPPLTQISDSIPKLGMKSRTGRMGQHNEGGEEKTREEQPLFPPPPPAAGSRPKFITGVKNLTEERDAIPEKAPPPPAALSDAVTPTLAANPRNFYRKEHEATLMPPPTLTAAARKSELSTSVSQDEASK